MRLALALAALILAAASGACAAPVLMISIDGLRPGDILEARSRGVTAPYLVGLAQRGLTATGVRNALPTVTYPNHTTLVTGVWPSAHGIAANTTFDPLHKNAEGWYWYAPDIRVQTLWDAAHAAGRVVASLGWPVTVDNASIDDDLPEYWRARTPEDAELEHALATPGLPEAVFKDSGVRLIEMQDTEPQNDEAKARAAAAIFRLKRPSFFTLHLSSLDHLEHQYGPGSREADAALQRIDAAIAGLVQSARSVEPDLVVFIVSDHGFAPISRSINLGAAFVSAGLITLDARGAPIAWEASPWISGGSAQVVLARRDDPALRAKVEALLNGLAADPESGINRVLDRAGIAAMGGAPDGDFFVDAKIGYDFGPGLRGALVTPSTQKGTHGYFPDHPEMRATLIIDDAQIKASGSLGEVDMRDIAPTAAEVLGVALPAAAGRSLLPR